MPKPGLKEVNENHYKLSINGVLSIKDGKFRVDISEESDGTDMKELEPYFGKLLGENISLNLKKVEPVKLDKPK